MLEDGDFKLLSQTGKALWADDHQSFLALSEVLSGVAYGGYDTDQSLEKAVSALLKRCKNEGCRATEARVTEPYYRLSAEQRLLLSGLHTGRWSYSRMAKILNWSIEEVAEGAWSTRLHLSWMPGSEFKGLHPSGSLRLGLNCPEYDEQKPWTQKFLDEEIATQERIFLQDHLKICETCQSALTRCRSLYFYVEGHLPRFSEDENQLRSNALKQIYRKMWLHQHPSERTFLESLSGFLKF